MPEAKRCRPALPALLCFLVFASVPTLAPGVEGSDAPRSRPRDLQAPAGDRRTLLELLLKALGDGAGGSHQALPHSLGPERVIARRYSGSAALHPAPAADQEPRGLLFSSASSSRERTAGQPARLSSTPRHGEVFPRDSNLKDKFIKHFTGPVTFSAECSKHFHRLYHNTRDCSTPASYCVNRVNGIEAGQLVGLQKVCKIADEISNEPTVYTAIGGLLTFLLRQSSGLPRKCLEIYPKTTEKTS